MRDEPIDFIGVNYAVDDRRAAEEIFPIAEERIQSVMPDCAQYLDSPK